MSNPIWSPKVVEYIHTIRNTKQWTISLGIDDVSYWPFFTCQKLPGGEVVEGHWHEGRSDKLLSGAWVVQGEREREMRGVKVCLVLTFKAYVSGIQALICEIAQKMLNTREQLLFRLPTPSSGRYGVNRTLNWEKVILKSFPHPPLPPFGNSPLWNLVQWTDLVLMFTLIWCGFQGKPGPVTEEIRPVLCLYEVQRDSQLWSTAAGSASMVFLFICFLDLSSMFFSPFSS